MINLVIKAKFQDCFSSFRLQRLRNRATDAGASTSSGSSLPAQPTGEVNPEFLAALPPSIQEEVLAQQRVQRAATARSDEPVDAAQFLEALPSSLRQTILTDLDNSQFAALPPDVAQEAQTLRRQREERVRHAHDHILQGGSSSGRGHTLSHILRNTARLGTRLMQSSSWSTSWNLQPSTPASASQHQIIAGSKIRGRQLLDHEALSCLLVLLFLDETKLNTTRLHRVLRYLCNHQPTRQWIIRTLLSIMEKCHDIQVSQQSSINSRLSITDAEPHSVAPVTPDHSKGAIRKGSKNTMVSSTPLPTTDRNNPAWLSMSIDAALGCRANIFQIQRPLQTGKKSTAVTPAAVTIHAQASPLVCKHALDALIALSKNFTVHFLPYRKKIEDSSKTETTKKGNGSGETKEEGSNSSSKPKDTDFWDLLVKLDTVNVCKKGKGLARSHSSSGTSSVEEELYNLPLEQSPLGQLIEQLAHPVIRRSSLLTDKLLRLLALVSTGLSSSTSTATYSAQQKHIYSAPNLEAIERLFALAIQVLTSKSCSEEGLEDATAILVNLSQCPAPARSLVLRLLLKGAATLGSTVASHINALLNDLKQHASRPSDHQQQTSRGTLRDRFTQEDVVIVGRTGPRNKPSGAGSELQLPSMAALTSKTSSQAFFLRTLKVIVQLRDASALRKAKKKADQRENAMIDAIAAAASIEIEIPPRPAGEDVVTDASIDAAAATTTSMTPPSNTDEAAAPAADPTASTSTGVAGAIATPATDTTASTSEGVASEGAAYVEQMDASENVDLPEVSGSDVSMDLLSNSTWPPAVIGSDSTITATNSNDATNADPANAGSAAAAAAPAETGATGGAAPATSEAMEVDDQDDDEPELKSLSQELNLDELWAALSCCLDELAESPDSHAVLVLQPAVEAFFLVHATAAAAVAQTRNVVVNNPANQEARESQLAHINDIAPLSPLPSTSEEIEATTSKEITATPTEATASTSQLSDSEKFLKFAERHRSVLNQILRQSTVHLADGPFSVLVDHIRLLDFDIKRKYFRTELERADDGVRREDLTVHVRRDHVFEDSFRELHRRSADDWKNRFYIVFEGEEGQDAGGLLREWYMIISREIFNPMYALFCISPGDRVTYMINSSSHCNSNHLSYFKFVGRVIAKAVYDNKLLECYFTRSFYKHILGIMVRFTDMESEDYSFYQGLIYLMDHDVADLGYELTFNTEVTHKYHIQNISISLRVFYSHFLPMSNFLNTVFFIMYRNQSHSNSYTTGEGGGFVIFRLFK